MVTAGDGAALLPNFPLAQAARAKLIPTASPEARNLRRVGVVVCLSIVIDPRRLTSSFRFTWFITSFPSISCLPQSQNTTST
jgi:hypothetical protein